MIEKLLGIINTATQLPYVLGLILFRLNDLDERLDTTDENMEQIDARLMEQEDEYKTDKRLQRDNYKNIDLHKKLENARDRARLLKEQSKEETPNA